MPQIGHNVSSSVIERNNVKVFGTGSVPLLFAHGFGCDQNVWRFVAPAFEQRYKVVLFDYVGAGQSDSTAYDPERYRTLHGYAQDVIDICDALELEPAIFVGHSVSSMIGVLASIERPAAIKRLVLVGPTPRYLNDPPGYIGGFERDDIDGLLDLMDKNYMGWASYLAPIVMGNPERPELGAELEDKFCSTDPAMARRFAPATFLADNRADLARVTVPSLIMQCSADLIAPAAVGDYLHEQLPASELVTMRATGHCPHMSDPEETIAIILGHLARHDS
jgi:sigma-B regulation protein RsbQ